MTDNTKPLPLVIITGNIGDAISDLLPRMVSFSKQTLRGEMEDGPFMIVRVETPERLFGLKIRGYEIHSSANDRPWSEVEKCLSIAKTRIRRTAAAPTEGPVLRVATGAVICGGSVMTLWWLANMFLMQING